MTHFMRLSQLKNLAFTLLVFAVPALAGDCNTAGFSCINQDTQIKGSRPPSFGTESGSTNTFVLTTVAPLGPALKPGSKFFFIATHSNTSSATLAVDGGSAIAIVKNISSPLVAADIRSGQWVEVGYDGTNFQCMTCTSASGGGGAGNFDPTTGLHLYDEFCGALSGSLIGELSWFFNGGGGGGARYTNSAAVNQNQHPCLFYISASSGANWEWLVLGPINSATAFRGIDTIAWTIQASVSDGIDTGASKFDTTLRFGWVNNTGVSTGSSGMYFECVSPASPTSANWSAVSQDAGGSTSTNTGVPCNANFNFNDLKITNDGAGNLTYYINGTSVATQNTHVTSGAVTPAFGILNTNSSTNAHQFGIDYFDLDMTLGR
jgi:hypothetical protein